MLGRNKHAIKLCKKHSGEYFDTANDREVWNLNILWIVASLAIEGKWRQIKWKEIFVLIWKRCSDVENTNGTRKEVQQGTGNYV